MTPTNLIELRKLAKAVLIAKANFNDYFSIDAISSTLEDLANKCGGETVIELLDTVEAQAKQIEQLESTNAANMETCTGIIKGLAAQIEALQADTERLDWLEKDQAGRVFPIVNKWYTRKGYGMPWTKQENLRAAIDAARKGKT